MLVLVAAAVVALVATAVALSAPNAVSSSRAGRITQPVGPNDLGPAACAGITLTTLVIGTTGTNSADLLLGSAGPDILNGRPGNDCIVGGAGDDTIDGGGGTDVCIGGPGVDTFKNCQTAIQ